MSLNINKYLKINSKRKRRFTKIFTFYFKFYKRKIKHIIHTESKFVTVKSEKPAFICSNCGECTNYPQKSVKSTGCSGCILAIIAISCFILSIALSNLFIMMISAIIVIAVLFNGTTQKLTPTNICPNCEADSTLCPVNSRRGEKLFEEYYPDWKNTQTIEIKTRNIASDIIIAIIATVLLCILTTVRPKYKHAPYKETNVKAEYNIANVSNIPENSPKTTNTNCEKFAKNIQNKLLGTQFTDATKDINFYYNNSCNVNDYFYKSPEFDKWYVLAINSWNMANYYEKRGDCTQAIKNYNETINFFSKSKKEISHSFIPFVYKEIGKQYHKSKNYNEAILNFNKALSYADNKNQMILLYTDIGDSYFEMGDYQKAYDSYIISYEKINDMPYSNPIKKEIIENDYNILLKKIDVTQQYLYNQMDKTSTM